MKLKANPLITLGLTSAIAMSTLVHVQKVNAEEAGTFYINPAVGYQMFDGDRDLDDSVTGILGGEYVLLPKWGIEATYLRSSPDGDGGNDDADLDQFRLGALYYLPEFNKFKPFLAAAVADAEFDYDSGDDSETQVHVGGGTRYSFNQDWSARFDARAINSLDEETWDALVSIGVSYAFGNKSEDMPPRPLDSDGDGIYDDQDQCPNTPTGVSVDGKGCPLDSDGDGVYDHQDQCPNTPAGVSVNAQGCALDSDGDGVPDHLDKCPNSPTGSTVDERGCPVLVEKTVSIDLAINFANNSAQVPQASYSEIKRVADFMVQYPSTKVTIEGHTDDRGNSDYNKSLSQKRADSTAAILISKYKIDSTRVKAIGYGEEKPIADNSTSSGRSENRRVVAEIEEVVMK